MLQFNPGPVAQRGDAETAVFSPKDDLIPVNGDSVQGWQTPDDVVLLLAIVARQKPTATHIRMRKKDR